VRREKVLVHSGRKDPPGNWIASPGSNRSGGGGNKAAGAAGVEGRIRRLGESAGCNVSELSGELETCHGGANEAPANERAGFGWAVPKPSRHPSTSPNDQIATSAVLILRSTT
jgi:hypothetical protein